MQLSQQFKKNRIFRRFLELYPTNKTGFRESAADAEGPEREATLFDLLATAEIYLSGDER